MDAEAEFNAILHDERHQRPGFIFSDSDEDAEDGHQTTVVNRNDTTSVLGSQGVTAGIQVGYHDAGERTEH
jgi:hypothetical protein